MTNLLFILAYSECICNNIDSHLKAMRFLDIDRWYNPKFCSALDGRDTRVDYEHYDF